MRFEPALPRLALLPRPRLLEAVQSRWSRQLTAIVAPAGFGKSTLAAQACAENALVSRGCDVWFGCVPADADAAHLAGDIATALGCDIASADDPDELAHRINDALWMRAPEEICLVLDDVHALADPSSGLVFLRRLVDNLPSNAHLVLCSRSIPPLGLARRAAAGTAVVIGQDDLTLRDEEVAAFADLRGVAPEAIAGAHGWLALATLHATRPGVTADDYLVDEIIEPLDGVQRAVLVALAAIGDADHELLTTVLGDPADADVVEALPLVAVGADGSLMLHAVLADAVVAAADPAEIARLRVRAARLHRERGNLTRGLELLAAAEAYDEIRLAVRHAIVDQIGSTGIDEYVLWDRAIPSALDTVPEVMVVRALAVQLRDSHLAGERLDRAVDAFAARDDLDGEMAATRHLALHAYTAKDFSRVLPRIARVEAVAASGHAGAVTLQRLWRGALASMTEQWDEAIALLDDLRAPEYGAYGATASYLVVRALIEKGRIADAMTAVDEMTDAQRAAMPDGYLSLLCTTMMLSGDLAGVCELADTRLVPMATSEHMRAPVRVAMAARAARIMLHAGRKEDARQLLERSAEIEALPIDRSVAQVRIVRAGLAVLDEDEERAIALLADIVESLTQRFDRGFATEYLGFLYVLAPHSRAEYDAMDLVGPFARQRSLLRAFVAAREEHDLALLATHEWPEHDMMRIFMFEPWIVELTAYARAARNPMQSSYVEDIGPKYRNAWRRLAKHRDRIGRAAADLLREIPTLPPRPVTVRVLGPTAIETDGEAVESAETRRERVRALLGYLVAHPEMSRYQIADALWPDAPPDAGALNLRVTLSYLQKALDANRDGQERGPSIQQVNGTLSFAPNVHVDAVEFDRLIDEAQQAERASMPSEALVRYRDACDLYRGDYLGDLVDSEWVALPRERYRARFVRAAVRTAELLAAGGDADAALGYATRATTIDPYVEAGYAGAVRCHVQLGEIGAAISVAQQGIAVLADIGIEAVSLQRLVETIGARAGEDGESLTPR